MLKSNIIEQLNSGNVSVNTQLTKERFESFWKNATNAKKNEAVKIGAYKDTRSFTNAKNSGQISVRMIVSLSIIFDIDPFWLNAESSINNGFSEDSLNKFLKKYGFEKFCTYNNEILQKQDILKNVATILEKVSNEDFRNISKLDDEEYLTLLKSLLIKSKRRKDFTLDIIKILLLQ